MEDSTGPFYSLFTTGRFTWFLSFVFDDRFSAYKSASKTKTRFPFRLNHKVKLIIELSPFQIQECFSNRVLKVIISAIALQNAIKERVEFSLIYQTNVNEGQRRFRFRSAHVTE